MPTGSFVWRHADDPGDAELRETLATSGFSGRHVQLAIERNVITLAERDGDRLFVLLQILGGEGRLFQVALFVEETALLSVLGPRPESYEVDAGAEVVSQLIDSAPAMSEPRDVVSNALTIIAGNLEAALGVAANSAGVLDREMRTQLPRDPEQFLERAFAVRHDLVTIGNRITQTREACAVAGFDEMRDRFMQLRGRLDGEAEFLQGVLDYYQSLTNTKMNIAMERLAVIAAVTLPVSAIGGILGMNTIVSDETNLAVNLLMLGLMLSLTVWMLVYARRRGWW